MRRTVHGFATHVVERMTRTAAIALVAAAGFAANARSETTLVIEYDPDPCRHVAALAEGAPSGSSLEVGPVALDLSTFAYVTCEKVREDIVASINARVESVRTSVDARVQEGVSYIYDSFWTWLSQEVYARLPEADRAAMQPEQYFQEWLKNPDQELVYYVNWYFRQKAPTIYAALERYRNDTSGEIVDGLTKLWTSAREKLAALDEAYDDIEANPDTPYADILKDHGLSGEWIDQLENYEGRFELFDQQWGIVEASKTMYGAFTADTYAGQLEGMFGLMEQLGGLLEDSSVPGVSLMGTLVKAYGEMAKEILKRANELEAAIRKREGYCIGADTHTLLDDRAQALMRSFGDGVQACPLDDKKVPDKDIYVQTEPDDANQLYFWVNGDFVKGIEGGGGEEGLDRAKAFIAEAGASFPPYQGKESDLPTLISVYNTPYRPEVALEGLPGHTPGRGLPGLLEESDRLFDSIVTRVQALRSAFAPDAACGEEALHSWISRESGLSVARFPLDDPETLGKLKTSYALGFIQGHNLVPGAAIQRTQAYKTFRAIWPELREISLAVITGDVRDAAHKELPCARCGGAELDIAVSDGEALCLVRAADERARFRQRIGTRSTSVSARLTASVEGEPGETVVVDERHFGLSGRETPFIAGFDLSLFVPLDREDLDASDALARMHGIFGDAEAASEAVSGACSRLEAGLAVLDGAFPEIARMMAELQADEAELAANSARIRQIHAQATSLSEQADAASLRVVEAKDLTEEKAESACSAAEELQATDEDDEAARADLLATARNEAAAARGAARSAADHAERARQAAQSITDAVSRGEDLGTLLGRIRETRRGLAQQRSSAGDAIQTVMEAAAVLEARAADLASLLEEARLVARQASTANGDGSASSALAEIQGLLAAMEGFVSEAETCRERHVDRAEDAQAAWSEMRPEEGVGDSDSNSEAELRLMVADLQSFDSLARAGADVAEVYAAAAEDGAVQAETCARLGEGIAEGGDAATAAAVGAAIEACDFDNAELGLAQMAPSEERDRLSGRLAQARAQDSTVAEQIDAAQEMARGGDVSEAREVLQDARSSAVCDATRARADDLLASLEEEEPEEPGGTVAGEGGVAGDGFATDAEFWAGPWAGEVRLSEVEVDGTRTDGAGLLALIEREVARLKAEEARKAEEDEADESLGAVVGEAIASGIAEAIIAAIKVGVAVLDEGVPVTFTLAEEAGGYRLQVPGDGELAQQLGSNLQKLPLFLPVATGDLQLVYPLPEGNGGVTALLVRPESDGGDLQLRIELKATEQGPPDESVLSIRQLSIVIEGTPSRRLMSVEEAAAIITPQIEAAVSRYAPELRE